MLVLGVETSCDETGLALVRDGKLVCEVLASQTDMHAVFGGVVPEIASREHLRMLPLLLQDLLAKACASTPELGLTDIDAIAVARGPGLLGALLVGLSFAKGLCLGTGARLIGVNHLHAHLLAPGLEAELSTPALGLLVSGGHTHLYHMAASPDGPTRFRLLGRTLDDAAGEAFDKVAKLLNLPYPGGRYLDELAQGVEPDTRLFPRAYISNDNLDFSFSGLKTAVAEELGKRPHLTLAKMPTADELRAHGALALSRHGEELGLIAASFNWAVSETLRIKVERALDREPGVLGLVVAGGVAANSFVRKTMTSLAEQRRLALHLPGLALCTDNAAMIAHAGWQALRGGYAHGLDLESVPRGRAVPEDWAREAGFAAGETAAAHHPA
ncbi:MAG: tRNA (adenosine(37)-N6)-threonylcarbamoyltransferase complex transferase subunit TsaD [Proteobacteria bacterium]|nr:tRNA (adenosine(37)-N6)-threonylcarbamoyltransferase complex transferase subunit TsaD [Pseudomonadota bacterium]